MSFHETWGMFYHRTKPNKVESEGKAEHGICCNRRDNPADFMGSALHVVSHGPAGFKEKNQQ